MAALKMGAKGGDSALADVRHLPGAAARWPESGPQSGEIGKTTRIRDQEGPGRC